MWRHTICHISYFNHFMKKNFSRYLEIECRLNRMFGDNPVVRDPSHVTLWVRVDVTVCHMKLFLFLYSQFHLFKLSKQCKIYIFLNFLKTIWVGAGERKRKRAKKVLSTIWVTINLPVINTFYRLKISNFQRHFEN